MPNVTGRPGCRTTEMNGGSSASYLASTPCVPLFALRLIGVDTEGLLDYQGRAGIISIVQSNPRLVIFCADSFRKEKDEFSGPRSLSHSLRWSERERKTGAKHLHLARKFPTGDMQHELRKPTLRKHVLKELLSENYTQKSGGTH